MFRSQNMTKLYIINLRRKGNNEMMKNKQLTALKSVPKYDPCFMLYPSESTCTAEHDSP